MALKLLLSVKSISSNKMSLIQLNNMDLNDKVETLRTETAAHLPPNDYFDLFYCGKILTDDTTLEFYNLKNGSIIHVLIKPNTNQFKVKDPSTIDPETAKENVVIAFQSFVGNPRLEAALRRLTRRPQVIENIIKHFPDLGEDAVAISLLQDPDLLVHFINKETVERTSQQHPALMEVSLHLVKAIYDEARDYSMNSSSSLSTGASENVFNVDFTSDEEDFVQVFTRMRRRTTGGRSNGSPLRNNSRTPRSIITSEMFNQAMQQAFTTGDENQPSATSFSATQNTANSLQTNITLMREMGLTNDGINLQALQVTNGNVQAAIELVLSGFGDT